MRLHFNAKYPFCFLAAALAFLAQANAWAATPALQLAPCQLENMTGSASSRCGWLSVPENRDAGTSKEIRLRVTLIPALRTNAERDPLVILAGGPGQGAHDAYAIAGAAFAAVRRDRDIVLLDQRGTGQSNRLDCEFTDDIELESNDPQQLQAQARHCLSALHGDPRFYTTSVAVRDLEALRVALGYEKLNFYAVSYGTRVAQHYLRRYPSRVRTAVLDGVVPIDLALGPDIAPRAQQALDAIFDRCIAEFACNKAFPDIRGQFNALRERLAREPVKTELLDPVDAKPLRETLGPAQLSAAVRLLTYSDETASLLPLLIHQAQAERRPQSLLAQYLMIERNTGLQLAYGMHFAVVCSEDAPRWPHEQVSDAALTATYLGGTFMSGLQAVCDVWPRGVVDEGFSAPLHSEVPVLILSGGNDPVTPQQYGERALASFKNGRHLVLTGQGHGQIATGCMPRLVAQFVRSANAASLDTACLKGVAPTPFMLSTSGTEP
ncbi:MAG TPA: alpha/beta hydrolase [Povalibacter sp.]|nr:alpha/beta hydrolase [Povalibacter sp.]